MKPASNAAFFVAWAIWTSFLAGLGVLLLVIGLQQDALNAVLEPPVPILWLRTSAYVFAILLFPVIGGIRRRLEESFEKSAQAPSVGMRPSQSEAIRPMSGLVLALALAESIGIVGFVLFLMGDNLQTLYIFVTLSALAMLLYRPRAEHYR